MSQPLRMAGMSGTQPHRDRPGIETPGASRQLLRGLGRESPNTCWVQPPHVRRADTGHDRLSRPPREPSPPRDATPLLIPTTLWGRCFFLLTTGTLYGFGVPSPVMWQTPGRPRPPTGRGTT